jgi:AcrR family transcriptional regulator
LSRRAPAAARGKETPTTRDVILDAAERRFAERGFAAVSMREIAGDAGLRNQASLYHHFRHKRALYEAVLARGIEPILGLVAESAAAGDTPGTWGEAAVDRLVVYLADHPHLPRLIQRAALEDRRYLPSVIPRLLRPLYQQGLRVLAETRTSWAPADMPHLASALYLLIFGYFASAALFEAVTQQDPRSPAAVARQRKFVKIALGRLFAAPVAPAAPRAVRRRSG